MAEQIIVLGSGGGRDDDGYPIPGVPDRPVQIKTVQPLSLDEIAEDDRQGVRDALRVWARPGESVNPGDRVKIRGLTYHVLATAWDWSQNRRPVLSRHRPGVVFACVRGAG